MNQIPETLINFSVYRDGKDFLGVSDVVLPNLNSITQTISGAGIGGEIDVPVLGAFQAMSVTLNWRTVAKETIQLVAQQSTSLDFRGAQQVHNKKTGSLSVVPVKVTVRTIGKNSTLGNLQPASTTGSSNEHEVTYIKIVIDGKVALEIDKLNYIFIVDGVDQLAATRKALGMN